MAVRLLTGPSGSGKTGRAIEVFKQHSPLTHQHSVRYIVPTVSQVMQLRNVLLSDPKFPGMLGNPVCTFYDLARDILSAMKLGQQKRISEMQKTLMLKDIISRAPANYFDLVRDMPSFPDALGGEIGSLKLSEIGPDDLCRALESSGGDLPESSIRKIRDFAALYSSYQKDVLEAKGVHDPEGVLWRALVVARENPDLLTPYKCIILDGFPTLTPVQQDFIRVLAENCGDVTITLEYDFDRPEVFSAVRKSLDFLTGLPDCTVEKLPRRDNGDSALSHLQQYLFVSGSPQTGADDSVIMLAGATPAMEVELAAEEIKRIMREKGYGFTDIGVVARGTDKYRQRIESSFRQYNIPLASRNHPMAESALAQSVLLGMRIVVEGWKREHVLALLKSTYIPCSPDNCSSIENLAKMKGIQAGKSAWLNPWYDGDPTTDSRMSALKHVSDFDDACKSSSDTSSIKQAVETLVNSFRWHESDEALQEDYAAWKSVKGIMSEIVSSGELLGKEIDSSEFADLLELGIRSTGYQVHGMDTEGVSLLDANVLGGRKFKVIFVVGMLEKIFPRQHGEDPFLRDSERAVLNEFLPNKLPLSTEARDYERYLFCSVCESALERLYLCYPAADVSAKDSLPSFYLEDVKALFNSNIRTITRDLREVVPPVEKAESSEALLAGTVLGCCSTDGNPLQQEISAVAYNLLIGAKRLSPQDFVWSHEIESRLSDVKILDHISSRPPVFRVSGLENYGSCPFSYFCQSELKLSEVEEEPGALERGSILHSVLFTLYSEIFNGNGQPDPEINAVTARALELLDGSISQYSLVSAMPAHLRQIERNIMAGMLKRFLRDDLKKIRESGFTPKYFELEFGARKNTDRERASESTSKTFRLQLDDGEYAELVGKIDRIDADGYGNAIIIDYKSGQCPNTSGIDKGILLQAPLYSAAAGELFDINPVGAEYRSLKRLDRNTKIPEDELEEKTQTAKEFAALHIENIKNGEIAVKPVDCKSYCGFRPICRIDKWKQLELKNQITDGSAQA
ncbi:MAG: PD-(D/E)XK nuclease family protein [Armatimonadota bacterium]